MCDDSDIDILGEDDMYLERSSKNFDLPVEVSSEDDDPTVTGMRAIKKAKSELERERRDHLSQLFSYLQQVILNGQSKKETWKRGHTVSQALQVCRDLRSEENKLLVELEVHSQEYYKLRRRLGLLSRSNTKLESRNATVKRRLSGLVLTPPKLCSPEKRRVSMDDPKIKELNPLPLTKTEDGSKAEEVNKTLLSRKKPKKRSGLTDEEKEFYSLHDKIEDILYHVDSLWEEVKDDEEFGEEDLEFEEKKPNITEIDKKLNMVKIPALLSKSSNQEVSNINQESSQYISVTNIAKLINPQFLPTSGKDSPPNLAADSNVGAPIVKGSPKDESQLIIEGDKDKKDKKNSNQELDLIEALQAVDNLCREIIPDMDEPSSSDLEVKSAITKRPYRKTRNSKRFSDVIVLDEE